MKEQNDTPTLMPTQTDSGVCELEQILNDLSTAGWNLFTDEHSKRQVARHLAILGYSKQSWWISVEDDLPNEGEDLLIWIGSAKSARIRKGITEEERQKMRNGELPNPKNEYWCKSQGYTLIERSEIYTSADVHGNNLVPYCWELDGGNTLFGQRVKYWAHQPQPPKKKGGAE